VSDNSLVMLIVSYKLFGCVPIVFIISSLFSSLRVQLLFSVYIIIIIVLSQHSYLLHLVCFGFCLFCNCAVPVYSCIRAFS
jgi:hypothetical protein